MPWYEATLEGFTCHTETWDHVLEVDGKRDEVYTYTDVRLIDQTGAVLLRSEKQSAIMGDRNGFPNRVQAGSASALGGILTGDVFPYNPPWVRQGGLQSDRPPMLLWAGELTDDRAVLLIPSLWEWDGGQDVLNSFLNSLVDNGPAIVDAVVPLIAIFTGTPLPQDAIKKGVEVGLPALTRVIGGLVGVAGDRPVGMTGRGATELVFDPTVLVMNNRLAQLVTANDFGFGPGVIGIGYRDAAPLGNGAYTLYVKFARVADNLVFNDGLLWRERSSAPVYITFGGAKFWIPSPDWLFKYGTWDDVRVVPDGALANVPSIPRDGTVLREWSSAPVYVVINGEKCWIDTPERLINNYGGWSAVRVVPDKGLNQIPDGPPAS